MRITEEALYELEQMRWNAKISKKEISLRAPKDRKIIFRQQFDDDVTYGTICLNLHFVNIPNMPSPIIRGRNSVSRWFVCWDGISTSYVGNWYVGDINKV